MMAAASTGSDSSRRMAVRKTDQTNRGQLYGDMWWGDMLMQVVMKLIAPRMEDAPAKCRAKMARSIDGPAWARFPERGG